MINRAKSAGLIIEVAKAEPGKANLYRIVKNNFYIEGEIWVPSVFDPDFEVSSLGRYRNATNKKLIVGYAGPDGYLRTYLKKGNSEYGSIVIHRIVYFSFHPESFERHKDFVVDHIDGRRDNNRLDNLRLLSVAKNIEARVANRTDSQEILTKLILKFGYEKTLHKLQTLLEEEN